MSAVRAARPDHPGRRPRHHVRLARSSARPASWPRRSTTAAPRRPSASVRPILTVVTSLFLGIALYVGAIVTANTCSTLIAGHTRDRAAAPHRRHRRRRCVPASPATASSSACSARSSAPSSASCSPRTVRRHAARQRLAARHRRTCSSPWELLLPWSSPSCSPRGGPSRSDRAGCSPSPRSQALSSARRAQPRGGPAPARARKVSAILLIAGGAGLDPRRPGSSASAARRVLPAALGGFVSFTGIAVGATHHDAAGSAAGRPDRLSRPGLLLAGRNAVRAPTAPRGPPSGSSSA